jgi:hypothetical protein
LTSDFSIIILLVIEEASMRVLLICAGFCLLAGCAAEPEKKLQFDGLIVEFAASQRAVSVLIWLLVILVIVLAAVLMLRRRQDRSAQSQAFPAWLAGLPGSDSDIAELKVLSSGWSASDDLVALRAHIDSNTGLTQDQKLKHATTLGALYQRWRNESSQEGHLLGQLMRAVFDNGIGIFLSLFALAVFISLAFGLSNSSFFSSLAHVDQARGLITFLVAVCAVAVIMLTAINIFWGNQASFEDRFKAAKDLVTLVVGVLGTILGFYFGSLTGERVLQLSLDAPSSYSVVTAGSDIDLRATAKSGTPPYQYDILLVDADSKVTKTADNLRSDNGSISKKFSAPQSPGKHSVVLLVRDAKGLQTKESTDLIVQADTVKPPPKVGGPPKPVAAPESPRPADTPVGAEPSPAPPAVLPNPNAK